MGQRFFYKNKNVSKMDQQQKQIFTNPTIICSHCKKNMPFTIRQRNCIHSHILLLQFNCAECGTFIGENVIDMSQNAPTPSLDAELQSISESIQKVLSNSK